MTRKEREIRRNEMRAYKTEGHKHSWENLRLAHRLCNTKKSNIPLVKKITKIF